MIQLKITKKSIRNYFGIQSQFKVIAFTADRKPVYDFLLVIYSNLGSFLHHF